MRLYLGLSDFEDVCPGGVEGVFEARRRHRPQAPLKQYFAHVTVAFVIGSFYVKGLILFWVITIELGRGYL